MTSTYSHDFVVCPWCGKESGCRVDHLYGRDTSWRLWRCGKCQQSFRGTVRNTNVVTAEKTTDGGIRQRAMNLLKFEGVDGPVFFVMDGGTYTEDPNATDRDEQDSQRFFYEEHSCPTNWLRTCVAVIEDGDTDPHGFLSFVRAVEVDNGFDEDKADWEAMFPEAFGGQIIDHVAQVPVLTLSPPKGGKETA